MEENKKIEGFINRHKTEDGRLKAVSAIMELERRLVESERQLEEYRKVFLGMSEAFEEMNKRLDDVAPKTLILPGDNKWEKIV